MIFRLHFWEAKNPGGRLALLTALQTLWSFLSTFLNFSDMAQISPPLKYTLSIWWDLPCVVKARHAEHPPGVLSRLRLDWNSWWVLRPCWFLLELPHWFILSWTFEISSVLTRARMTWNAWHWLIHNKTSLSDS